MASPKLEAVRLLISLQIHSFGGGASGPVDELSGGGEGGRRELKNSRFQLEQLWVTYRDSRRSRLEGSEVQIWPLAVLY